MIRLYGKNITKYATDLKIIFKSCYKATKLIGNKNNRHENINFNQRFLSQDLRKLILPFNYFDCRGLLF